MPAPVKVKQQRQFHRKSRGGCLQCKHNRTKCDEIRPKCNRCTRTGQECSLRFIDSSLVVIDESGKTQKRATASKSPPDVPSGSEASGSISTQDKDSPPSCNIEPPHLYFSDGDRNQLRLMYHYTLFTSRSLADMVLPTNEGLAIWDNYVPQLAFSYDFVLHGILALSSLHLALLSMDEPAVQIHKHITLASRHHYNAIKRFNKEMPAVTAENVDAFFIFAGILVAYAYAVQRVPTRTSLAPPKRIAETLRLLRATGSLGKVGLPWLCHGRLGAVFSETRHVIAGQIPILPDRVENVLTILSERATKEAPWYGPAIGALRYNLQIASTDREPHQVPTSTFPLMAPAELLDAVELGVPLALAIVGNFSVLPHLQRGNIWLKDWGKQTSEDIRESLTSEWKDCLIDLDQDMPPNKNSPKSNRNSPKSEPVSDGPSVPSSLEEYKTSHSAASSI